MKCWFVRFYPELLLFYDEDKALIVVGVEVAHLHRRLLLLPDSLPLPVQQLDLNVRIWRERKACILEEKEEILLFDEVSRPWISLQYTAGAMLKSSSQFWENVLEYSQYPRTGNLDTEGSRSRALLHFDLAINLSIQMRPTI